MEVLIILLFIILVTLILVLRSSILDRLDRIEHEIGRLRDEVKQGRQEAARPDMTAAPRSPVAAPTWIPPASVPRETVPRETEPFRPPPAQPQQAAATRPVGNQPVSSGPVSSGPVSSGPVSTGSSRQAPAPPPGFFERHPDWEKFIGENLISKIGIAVLVLAIGFFVKYAIDNDWIGPVGRVGIGLLCGGILVAVAHWLRNQYAAFSSVLVGGGLAVFYFTIALAYHQYHLFGQTAAFVIMLIITAFSVALSLLYNREELAIIALAGGFVTPFLVSNGSGDYKVLFTYLLILNTGLLVIAYNKAWRLLNGLAFAFTAILFSTWLIRLSFDVAQSVYYGGAAFATAFYILFFIVNIAHTIRENKKFIGSDFAILLLNTCLYFGASLYFLSQLGLERYKGLFCAVMGVCHIALSYFLFRKQKVDNNILYLLIGITLSFVSLTAPLQLHGHYITLFWASESVLLYWLFLKSNLRLIRLASRLILAAMLVSLIMDWFNIYISGLGFIPILFNKGFMTGFFCSACCYALFWLQRESKMGLAILFTGTVVLYFVGVLEIEYQFGYFYPILSVTTFYILLYTWLFIRLFTSFNPRLSSFDFRFLNMVLLGLGLVVYLAELPAVFGLQQDMLEGQRYPLHFIAHWVGAAVVFSILYKLTGLFRTGDWKFEPALFTWGICIITVIFLSAEGQLLVNMLFYSKENSLDTLQRVYSKTGLPILWGLCSFICMWMGMHYKFKPLRIFSLTLFSVTLFKLFLFDIRNIPVAGKIAAFFCLGVLLLVVSFMYQRLKKIIIADEKKHLD